MHDHHRRAAALWALLALAACDPTDPAGDDTSASPEACVARTLDDCEALAGCRLVYAQQGIADTGGEVCWGEERVAVACDAVQDCGDAMTPGAPESDPGDCWLFSNTCRPPGWGPCGDTGDCEG